MVKKRLLCFRCVILAFLLALPVLTTRDATAASDMHVGQKASTQQGTNAVEEAASATNARSSQPTFGLDRVKALQVEIGSYPLWQYCASLVWVILAFVLAAVIDVLMTHQLRRLAAKTKTDLDDKLLEILRTPVKAVVVLLMLNAGISMFQWPDWAEKVLSVLFAVSVAAIATYAVVRLVDVLATYAERKLFPDDAHMAQLLMPVLARSLKVFVVIIAVLTTAQYLGLPITSVIAGLGIGGVAVALAAQSSLANMFGTITILLDRPFRVGDRVQVDKYDGSVEAIGLRSTRIRTLEGHLVTIPNKTMADSAINNVSLRPNIRQLMTISLTYDTSHDRMQEAVKTLREIFQQHPLTHDAWVYWKDYGPSSLDIFVVYWCKSTVYKEFLQTLEDLNLEIKKRFDAAGLDFAFPTQTIQLLQPSTEK
jgi:MscS family membrane protein